MQESIQDGDVPVSFGSTIIIPAKMKPFKAVAKLVNKETGEVVYIDVEKQMAPHNENEDEPL